MKLLLLIAAIASVSACGRVETIEDWCSASQYEYFAKQKCLAAEVCAKDYRMFYDIELFERKCPAYLPANREPAVERP